ncbi:anthranilate phosphoribosyltransferase [Sphingomonas sp.]|uniref:anthranilate phosphoribosyltransferase n=1 Tax=Sphingomonas sp. TaxID=28214 RepID=UPI00389E9895
MNQILNFVRDAVGAPAAAHAPHAHDPRQPVANPLPKLLAGEDLPIDDSEHLFERLVLGRLEPAEIAGMLIALRMKGETADEMIGAARALSAAALPFARPDYLYADCCGTGGDGSGLINVSTATALVAAACGLPIAKHGNRSVSSRCGSADVLEALGAKIDIGPQKARALLDDVGFCFLFAPAYHPGMKHAALVRRQLQVRTVMNLLGPCINPARPAVQLLGVADPRMLRRIAETLAAMGVREALVVHGGGLDEVALHSETRAIRLSRGEFEELEITPEEAGLERAPVNVVTGGEVEENAARLQALLGGRGSRAEEDIIFLNTAALLRTAGMVSTLREGAALARDALASGGAAKVLAEFLEASRD